MNDRQIMEDLLQNTKGLCDLYLHGVIESSTPQVHETFQTALNDTLCMQNGVYSQMESRGWYQKSQEQQQKIQQVRQKFAAPQG